MIIGLKSGRYVLTRELLEVYNEGDGRMETLDWVCFWQMPPLAFDPVRQSPQHWGFRHQDPVVSLTLRTAVEEGLLPPDCFGIKPGSDGRCTIELTIQRPTARRLDEEKGGKA